MDKIQKTIPALSIIMILSAVLIFSSHSAIFASETGTNHREDICREDIHGKDDQTDPLRGIWLSCFDYAALGLTISESEERYRENAEQIEELEDKGADGYVYFSARHLFKNKAAEELSNIRTSEQQAYKRTIQQ